MNRLLRVVLMVCVLSGSAFVAGCGEKDKIAPGDPNAKPAPPSTNTKASPKEGGPAKGSSAGMNRNPGGNF